MVLGVVGSDHLLPSQEDEKKKQFRPPYSAFLSPPKPMGHGMAGRCLYVCVCVCRTALVH